MTVEDLRKTALKKGLRQLTERQLLRVLSYAGTMAHDRGDTKNGNYVDGHYCPLAVGVGLHLLDWKPTDQIVRDMLVALGLDPNNTRGVEGTFYRENRDRDCRIAAEEVLAEKRELRLSREVRT